ncbi:MAG: hypothetical protein R3B40_09140 [Polyangiales bacterium]|nr:hypothetical protein [Myxococcales bacterium]MCB9656228.1 hypothetical protein [Sandaracinaceae bacterium]
MSVVLGCAALTFGTTTAAQGTGELPEGAEPQDEAPGAPQQPPPESASSLGQSAPGAEPLAREGWSTQGDTRDGAEQHAAGWVLFEAAIRQRAEGNRRAARALLQRLLSEHPRHPAAPRAQRLVDELDASLRAEPGDTPASRGREDPTLLARAEFVTSQTLLGTTYGIVPCVIGGCHNARSWVLASLAGAGAGLGFSLLYSRDGITPGASYTMDTSALWGATMGYLLTGSLGSFYDDYGGFRDGNILALGVLLGQLGGLGVGALLNATLQPTAGEAALASSTGMWSATLVTLVAIAAADGFSDAGVRGLHGGVALSALLGMSLGGYFGHRDGFTRGRVLLMDLGAAVGGSLAVALGFLFRGNNLTAEGLLVGSAAGIVGGFVLSGFITRSLRATPSEHVSVQVGPTRGGAHVQLSARF